MKLTGYQQGGYAAEDESEVHAAEDESEVHGPSGPHGPYCDEPAARAAEGMELNCDGVYVITSEDVFNGTKVRVKGDVATLQQNGLSMRILTNSEGAWLVFDGHRTGFKTTSLECDTITWTKSEKIVKWTKAGSWPNDPFPSAVIHIDEDAERDVREAQQHAYPVAPAGEARGVILRQKMHRSSRAPSTSLGSVHTDASWISAPHAGNRCFLANTLFKIVDPGGNDTWLCRAEHLDRGMQVRGLYRNLNIESAKVQKGQQCELVELNVGDDTPPLTVTGNHRVVTELCGASSKTRKAMELEEGDVVCCSSGGYKTLTDVRKSTAVVDIVAVRFKPDEPVKAFDVQHLDTNSSGTRAILSKGQKRIRRGGMRPSGFSSADMWSIPETEDSFL